MHKSCLPVIAKLRNEDFHVLKSSVRKALNEFSEWLYDLRKCIISFLKPPLLSFKKKIKEVFKMKQRKNKDERCNHVDKQINWPSRRLAGIYRGMLSRCNNPKDKSYRFYGAKKIRVCEEWMTNPQAFINWALESGYNKDLTINRIDECKGYFPANCEWIPRDENSKWKSSTNYISVIGIIDSGRGWSRRLGHGINYVNKYLRKNGYELTVIMIMQTICKSPELQIKYNHELVRKNHLDQMRKL